MMAHDHDLYQKMNSAIEVYMKQLGLKQLGLNFMADLDRV